MPDEGPPPDATPSPPAGDDDDGAPEVDAPHGDAALPPHDSAAPSAAGAALAAAAGAAAAAGGDNPVAALDAMLKRCEAALSAARTMQQAVQQNVAGLATGAVGGADDELARYARNMSSDAAAAVATAAGQVSAVKTCLHREVEKKRRRMRDEMQETEAKRARLQAEMAALDAAYPLAHDTAGAGA